MTSGAGERRGGAWLELLRLGNVFTAASNVVAGFALARGDWRPAGTLAALVAASAALYLAGMVLNDAFDAEVDKSERPERPIPSGRIPRGAALLAGWSLLAVGVAIAAAIGVCTGNVNPPIVGACLAMAIVLYDGGLKRRAAGPWAMGWCRLLNVLLGASAAADLSQRLAPWLYAAAVGSYTVALTYLARKEASGDAQRDRRTRRAVGRMIRGFIPLDAAATAAACGPLAGLALLALLVPTQLLARRAPMT